MTWQPLALIALSALAVTTLSACQSTKDRSAELESHASTSLVSEKGLRIEKESSDVKVTSTALLTGDEADAVVVDLHNSSAKSLTNVPILIEVLNAKGGSFYKNDIPGIEPALAAVPYIPAHGDAEWVNDQVLGVGEPKSVKVKVGESDSSYSGPMPEIDVSEPTLQGDPVSGISAIGTVVNRTGEDQDRLLLYAVARRGDRVVAAGRGALEHIKPEPKKLKYTIFFVGDPKGANLTLSDYPTLSGSEEKGKP
jgi:hypothetical protein